MSRSLHRPLGLALAALATTSLGGCYYGDVYGASDYGYGGNDCATRYGDTYYDSDGYAYDDGYGYDCYDAGDYGGGFAQIGFGGGWYDNYFYPGYGLWVFDTYNRRYPLRGQYLNYWGGRRAWWKHHGGRDGEWRGRDGQGRGNGEWRGDRDGRPGDGRGNGRDGRPGRGNGSNSGQVGQAPVAATPAVGAQPTRPSYPGASQVRPGRTTDAVRQRPPRNLSESPRVDRGTTPAPLTRPDRGPGVVRTAPRPSLPTAQVAPAPAARAAPPAARSAPPPAAVSAPAPARPAPAARTSRADRPNGVRED